MPLPVRSGLLPCILLLMVMTTGLTIVIRPKTFKYMDLYLFISNIEVNSACKSALDWILITLPFHTHKFNKDGALKRADLQWEVRGLNLPHLVRERSVECPNNNCQVAISDWCRQCIVLKKLRVKFVKNYVKYYFYCLSDSLKE